MRTVKTKLTSESTSWHATNKAQTGHTCASARWNAAAASTRKTVMYERMLLKVVMMQKLLSWRRKVDCVVFVAVG
jgi:hypothetical protein